MPFSEQAEIMTDRVPESPFTLPGLRVAKLGVRDQKGLGCNVALIKCTLDSGKPKGGWDFGREGTGGHVGNRGS